jgi:hypothetical protein
MNHGVLDHISWEDAMSNLQRVDRLLSVKEIKANPRNARTHSKAQIRQIGDSIKACGFGAPVLVDETLTLIAGHGRFKAAELLGLGTYRRSSSSVSPTRRSAPWRSRIIKSPRMPAGTVSA